MPAAMMAEVTVCSPRPFALRLMNQPLMLEVGRTPAVLQAGAFGGVAGPGVPDAVREVVHPGRVVQAGGAGRRQTIPVHVEAVDDGAVGILALQRMLPVARTERQVHLVSGCRQQRWSEQKFSSCAVGIGDPIHGPIALR